MGRKYKTKISSALRDYPANAGSNLGMGLMGLIGPMGLMGKQPVTKISPAQRDSGMSNLGMGLMGLIGPMRLMGKKPVTKNSPAQRDSRMSNLKEESETSLAQLDSGMSNLGMGLIGPMGLMGKKPVTKTSPAQRDSGMSNLPGGTVALDSRHRQTFGTDILLKMSLGTGKDAILCYLFVLLIVKNRRTRMKEGCRI